MRRLWELLNTNILSTIIGGVLSGVILMVIVGLIAFIGGLASPNSTKDVRQPVPTFSKIDLLQNHVTSHSIECDIKIISFEITPLNRTVGKEREAGVWSYSVRGTANGLDFFISDRVNGAGRNILDAEDQALREIALRTTKNDFVSKACS